MWNENSANLLIMFLQNLGKNKRISEIFFLIIWSEIINVWGPVTGETSVRACASPSLPDCHAAPGASAGVRVCGCWWTSGQMQWWAGDKERNTGRLLQGQDPGLGDYCSLVKLKSAPWVGEWNTTAPGQRWEIEWCCWCCLSSRECERFWLCSSMQSLCTCLHGYMVYSCVLCAYWEKLLSLVTACVWERDGAASPLVAAGFNPSKHYQMLLSHQIFCCLALRVKIEEKLQLNYKT